METNEISGEIVDSALRLHRELGPGLLEIVYEVVLAELLREKGFVVARQRPIPIRAFGKLFEEGSRADLIVKECVLVELKSLERLLPVHKKQVQTYVRLANLQVGLLINFGGALLKGNVERIVVGAAPDLHAEAISPE